MYRSLVLVADADPARSLRDTRGYRCAYNSRDSLSGYLALKHHLAGLGIEGRFFSASVATGAHRRSMELLQRGEVDVCAIDCVTFSLLQQYASASVSGLRIVAQTGTLPGLPLVTARGRSDAELQRLRKVLAASLGDPFMDTCNRALLIDGYEVLEASAYDVVIAMEKGARSVEL